MVSACVLISQQTVPINVKDFNESYNSIINFSIFPKELVKGWLDKVRKQLITDNKAKATSSTSTTDDL